MISMMETISPMLDEVQGILLFAGYASEGGYSVSPSCITLPSGETSDLIPLVLNEQRTNPDRIRFLLQADFIGVAEDHATDHHLVLAEVGVGTVRIASHLNGDPSRVTVSGVMYPEDLLDATMDSTLSHHVSDLAVLINAWRSS